MRVAIVVGVVSPLWCLVLGACGGPAKTSEPASTPAPSVTSGRNTSTPNAASSATAASSVEDASAPPTTAKCEDLGDFGMSDLLREKLDASADACWQRVDAAAFEGKQVNGRLAPEIIQRIVRQDFKRFRRCYEQGLAKKPTLTGRVVMKFVIDKEGNVVAAGDGGSDLPDADVVACVVAGYRRLKFPHPQGGNVTVVYPIVFNPEG